MTEQEIFKGLAGVPVDYTAISKVNPESNSLLYRGYPVQELAAQCTFEEVAYLLWHGELPNDAELAEFGEFERRHRGLDHQTKRIVDELPLEAHPMDVVRTAVSVIGASDPETPVDTPEANLDKAMRLFAKLPSIVAYDQRRRHGLEFVEPRDDLGYSANFLWQTFGEAPELAVVNAFDVSMILYAEHSFNASTFTARVIASTLSDLYSAVTGAIGALKGPLHGGANEAVMHAFAEIGPGEGGAERAVAWLDAALAEKRKIMGFGHRVYKNGDSRVPTMRDAMERMVEHYERPELLEVYVALEQAMGERKNIKPNLDYPAGPTYHLMGFDTPTFTPLFVASRVVGWTAHVMEQLASNALIRPLSVYNGVDERHVPAK
ncbi:MULTISPECIES: bifunctional 2-methylcitrate synthase/citrate synthase [Agromyces]|uniref:bifunctional 2-methylcitrate synthase/citrate synthase n=1 Tax=Agromyces TaxID=33877 RepID=UPI001E3D0F02|nr:MULTISPECIES: bifunctional 2-methylcitrate synthase/citrate synthase [Agromyces]MCD1571451.1 bifunctional 2-methylcitrate synthase/citrate synthase [Agromyces mediolanus]GLU87878.1 citrate synthase [Agromyces sp. NBRC 114283]